MLIRQSIAAGLLAVGSLLDTPQFAAAAEVDLELVLAVDVSGSIDEVEAGLQRRGYVQAITDPRVVHAIRGGTLGRIAVTYIEWAGTYHQRTVVGWTLIDDERSARAFAAVLEEAPPSTAVWTSISTAIDYAVTRLADSGHDGLRHVIDVSGDGYNNRGRPAQEARDAAVAMGITINGLPIMNGRPNRWGGMPPPDLDRYYEQFVIGGPGSFHIVAQDFEAFADAILHKLIREIAALPPVTTR